jgi:hypothetical protein
MKFNYNKLKVGVLLGVGSNYSEKTKVRCTYVSKNSILNSSSGMSGIYWDTRIVSYLSVDYILFTPGLIKNGKDSILINYEYEC